MNVWDFPKRVIVAYKSLKLSAGAVVLWTESMKWCSKCVTKFRHEESLTMDSETPCKWFFESLDFIQPDFYVVIVLPGSDGAPTTNCCLQNTLFSISFFGCNSYEL